MQPGEITNFYETGQTVMYANCLLTFMEPEVVISCPVLPDKWQERIKRDAIEYAKSQGYVYVKEGV